MINPLIHYELEMTTRQHQQLQRRVALWQLAHQAVTDGHHLARPNWLRIGLTLVTLVVKGAETMLQQGSMFVAGFIAPFSVARPKEEDSDAV